MNNHALLKREDIVSSFKTRYRYEALNLLEKMLAWQKESRADILEVKNHPFYWTISEKRSFIVKLHTMLKADRKILGLFTRDLMTLTLWSQYPTWFEVLDEPLQKWVEENQRKSNYRVDSNIDLIR